ncbi:sulfotransferase-like domain-containing protein [Lacimicrobium alkaliphilum]|uniref:Branched chain amino acid aminotransferase n=1 Tax=Lacimicrobium alkaliphilum TaxID=1526571 RepID=A0ABQ1RAB4_9ALTE|nr:hypothetical protein [Lacimicrobium alkaliphilum]GGD63832.1 branched chain amino acid aminotransferase [Lacimicrobium alkaliphilum]
MTIRIAMWSGPRNISTAMMRSWENRPDTEVVDEPFYASFLNQTGAVHPHQDEILAAQSSDFDAVARELSQGPVSSALQYQKQMTHHIPGQADMSWCASLRHCFLIRHPDKVVDSYSRSMGQCNAADIGIERQYTLYQQLCEISAQKIPVVDSDALLRSPEPMLKAICTALGVTFYPQMLKWPKGKRDADGVWAPHWYHSVEDSEGFSPPRDSLPELTEQQKAVAESCMPYYLKMKQRALEPE